LFTLFSCSLFVIDTERGKYKAWGIQHSLDIWHAAKSLSKRLRRVCISTFKDVTSFYMLSWCCEKKLAVVYLVYLDQAGTVKSQNGILPWIKDIVNHFWYCSKHADTEEQFKVWLREKKLF
jgi:hypothetical protein